MKTIHVPFLQDFTSKSIKKCSQSIERLGAVASIDTINWKEKYPYRPLTAVYVARSADALFVKYKVSGNSLKAVYIEDQSPVYEDSCVEFFCMSEGADRYNNFEFNCIGTCLASSRKGRDEDVQMLSASEMETIKRYSLLEKKPFNELIGQFDWELCVKIPFKLIGLDGDDLPTKIKANFYKCADNTETIHFVSWTPIDTPDPDFHRPEFFGELYF